MALPAWLIVLAIVALALALMASAYILGDILICKRQMMAVMKWVWPLTALYMGPFTVWAYRVMGLFGMVCAGSKDVGGPQADTGKQHLDGAV